MFKKQKSKKLKSRLKIVLATLTAVFSLFSVFTATAAWFASNTSTPVTGASVTVKALGGIQFDFYYLDHFVIDEDTNKDGNYDSVIGAYAGYEIATTNPVFKPISYDENGDVVDDVDHSLDPTSINHLWPAHKLTYAIVITSGVLNNFTLDSWSEITSPSILTRVNDQDVEISLSWAINIYGGAYYVPQTANVTDDIATGFTDYRDDVSDQTLTDKFTYSQTNIAPNVKPAINVADSISGTSGANKRVVLYFSIEFSDDNSTYYTYNNPYYVKDTLGNSNCYENLSLTGLSFKLS